MKRGGFLKRKTPLNAYTGFKPRTRPLLRISPKKRATVAKRRKLPHSEVPNWFRKIPYGSHGSTPVQKRAWKYISDMVRQDDFETYGGKCVSCPRILNHWKDGQCGHYIAWSVCNGLMKFNIKNLALQCPYCNHTSDGAIGRAFSEELQRRYGPDILLELFSENTRHHGTKLYDADVIALVTYFYKLDHETNLPTK